MSEEAVQYERLHSTTDVTVWAAEFVKNFDGWSIEVGNNADMVVNEGTLISWFANYAQACNDMLVSQRKVHPGTWYAFLHFFHTDHANAAMHTGAVRYSPITFRLAEFINDQFSMAPHIDREYAMLRQDPRLNMVLSDKGAYAEDTGR